VIAGYKRPGNDDSPKIIEETRAVQGVALWLKAA
jgi:hypothetical protein